MKISSIILPLLLAALFLPRPAAAQTKPDDPALYAMYGWAGDYTRYQADLKKMGIHWMRVGGWETGSKRTDNDVLLAAKDNFHLVPAIGGAVPAKGKTIDESITAWRTAVRADLARYATNGSLWKEHPEVPAAPILYWEIWNEPNIEFLNPPEGILRTDLYAKILSAASEEIRKADPAAKIIAFNTSGGGPNIGEDLRPDGMFQRLKYIGWRKFIRDVTTLTGPAAFDIVGTHPYSMPRPPEGNIDQGLDMTREVAKELHYAKPIWFTEVGWPLVYPRNQQVRDERQQACFAARLLAIGAAHGVTQIQFMFIEDIIFSGDNSQRSFGFFTAPGKWRQQATAVATMIRLLPDPRKDPKILSEEPNGIWAYQFQGASGQPIIMAWTAAKDPIDHSFPLTAKSATQVDMLGNSSPLPITNGQATVKLTEAPIYIIPEK